MRRVHEITTLNTEQVKALLNGDPDFARFDILIDVAAKRKREAKYSLLRHIREHGCLR